MTPFHARSLALLSSLAAFAMLSGMPGGSALAESPRLEDKPKDNGELYAGGYKKAAERFAYYLCNEFFADDKGPLKPWKQQQTIPRSQVGPRPVVFTSTGELIVDKKTGDYSAPARTYYYLWDVTKKGELLVSQGDFVNGQGLVLQRDIDKTTGESKVRVSILDAEKAKIDDTCLEKVFPYRSSIVPQTEEGYARLLDYAAWLYDNGAPWSGNRVLYWYTLRVPPNRAKVDKFIATMQKFPAGEELDIVTSGVDAQGADLANYSWKELAPKSKHASRREARETETKRELAICTKRVKESIENGDKLTWAALTAKSLPTGCGLNLLHMEREINDAESFARDSEALTADRKISDAAKAESKKAAEAKKTFTYWQDEAARRKKLVDDIAKQAEDVVAKAMSARTTAEKLKKEHKSAAAEEKTADENYAKAEELYARLIPRPGAAPKAAPLDSNNGRHNFQLGLVLRYSCGPDTQLEKCDDEKKARECIVQLEIAQRHAWGNGRARVEQGVCHMLVRNYDDAGDTFDKIIAEPGMDANVKLMAVAYKKANDQHLQFRKGGPKDPAKKVG
jgi:hypothetical protein